MILHTMLCIHNHWVWCKTDLKDSANIWGEKNSFFDMFLFSAGHTNQFEMSMCAFTSFLSKCLLPIYCFCLLLIVFSFYVSPLLPAAVCVISSKELLLLSVAHFFLVCCSFLFNISLPFPFFFFPNSFFFFLFLCGPPYQ